MVKRGNNYNKVRMASLQRIALNNLSTMDINDGQIFHGSIPGKNYFDSSILNGRKAKSLPKIKDFLHYRLINLKQRHKKFFEKDDISNKLPELINIKRSGMFKFHKYHDQFGRTRELDKKEIGESKMTQEKIRDIRILEKMKKINSFDPYLYERFKRMILYYK